VLWIVGSIVLLAGGYAVWGFNALVSDRNLVAQAFADVDVQLKRRADLVPQLVGIVKGYAAYERAALTGVTELRRRLQAVAAGPSAQRFDLEEGLGGALQRLIALNEGYPALKADSGFRDLATRLVEVEDQLQHARRFYNGAVNQYATRLQRFPDLLIARLFAFRAAAFFESDHRESIAVQL